MKVLVTGGAGYIGSQFIRDLGKKPIDNITILDNMSRECYHSLMDLPPSGEYEFIDGDIRDAKTVDRAVKGSDVVVHLAALTNAPESFERREETRDINYTGTLQVMKSCMNHSVKKMIYASTTSVYGQTQGIVDETYECHPVSPYALYKLKSETEIVEKARQHTIDVVALRLATVYGFSEGIRFHTVLNKFVFMACAGMPLTIYGTGEQKRPFLHVKDASRVLMFCMDNPVKTDVFNVVGHNASVNDIVTCIRNECPSVKTVNIDREILNQISYSVDSTKIQNMGFTVKSTIEDDIKELMSRFRVFFKR